MAGQETEVQEKAFIAGPTADGGLEFKPLDVSLKDIQATASSGEVETTDFRISNDSEYPATNQERIQEFVDGFGQVGKLYNDSVQSNDRLGKFQDRMMGVYAFDHASFKDLARVGESMTKQPPATPEEIGKSLANAFKSTLDRQLQHGDVDLQGKDFTNLEGAMAGMMLAARSTFDPAKMQEQTVAMVDAMDKQLRDRKVPQLQAIIWGDTKEPGLAVVPPNTTIDRHNFSG